MEQPLPQGATERHLPPMTFGKLDDMRSRVAVAIDAIHKYLFAIQADEGYWCGELEADTTLESDYILVHTILGTGDAVRMAKEFVEVICN